MNYGGEYFAMLMLPDKPTLEKKIAQASAAPQGGAH
jgi:hypothetical protein